MSGSEARVREWLQRMERCVGSLDYEGCRELFSPEVVGFGTRAFAADGLTALEHDQWREVWSRISGFRFVVEQLHCRDGGDLIAAYVPFDSRRVGPDGRQTDRPGRATVVLAADGDDLRAVHTHFSLAPA
jgi:ketosteroid isomerase-like protein